MSFALVMFPHSLLSSVSFFSSPVFNNPIQNNVTRQGIRESRRLRDLSKDTAVCHEGFPTLAVSFGKIPSLTSYIKLGFCALEVKHLGPNFLKIAPPFCSIDELVSQEKDVTRNLLEGYGLV